MINEASKQIVDELIEDVVADMCSDQVIFDLLQGN